MHGFRDTTSLGFLSYLVSQSSLPYANCFLVPGMSNRLFLHSSTLSFPAYADTFGNHMTLNKTQVAVSVCCLMLIPGIFPELQLYVICY